MKSLNFFLSHTLGKAINTGGNNNAHSVMMGVTRLNLNSAMADVIPKATTHTNV